MHLYMRYICSLQQPVPWDSSFIFWMMKLKHRLMKPVCLVIPHFQKDLSLRLYSLWRSRVF